MSELDDRLKKLEMELSALQRIKTQEDFDEGARLHNLHNAPWVKGQYSHLQFPPYTFQPYPAMIYKPGFEAAVAEYDQAQMLPAIGTDDRERSVAITKATRKMLAHTKTVADEAELRKYLAQGWCESRQAAIDADAEAQKAIELADAERAYADRLMTGPAAAERDRYEENADGFVPVIPEQPIRVRGGNRGKAKAGARA